MEKGHRAVSRKSVGFIFAVKKTAGSLSLSFLLVPHISVRERMTREPHQTKGGEGIGDL